MLFFKKKESRMQKAQRYALNTLGILTNVAFLGACYSVIKQSKDVEEQKELLREHLELYHRDINDRRMMHQQSRQDAAMERAHRAQDLH